MCVRASAVGSAVCSLRVNVISNHLFVQSGELDATKHGADSFLAIAKVSPQKTLRLESGKSMWIVEVYCG